MIYLPEVRFSKDNFNINIKLVKEYGARENFNFKFDGEFLTAEKSYGQNSLRDNLEEIIFKSFEFEPPFLENCEAPGDFSPLDFSLNHNLKITVQTTNANFKLLVCTY